jgi:carbamoyltransferase
MKIILGISAFYHDSAAAILIDGKIIAAAQEERFTRVKNTPDFPVYAIRYCLEEAGIDLDDLDAVVFYDKPFLKFERLLETYYAFSPSGIFSFLKSIPVWLNEKIFLKKNIYKGLSEVSDFNKQSFMLLFTEHHISHAASAFYPSPFNEAAILTIDGVGEWATASIGIGTSNEIKIIKEMHFPHSVGLLYSAFTYFLGFTVNSGEYKLMGLAPYGNPESDETLRFISIIKTKIVDIKEDGSIWLDQIYFDYSTGLRMIKVKKWERIFGFTLREPEAEILQHHCNLAFAIQAVIEEIIIKMAYEAKRITGKDNLCIAGGVALNCVANGKLMSLGIFKDIFVQPAAGDAGGSLGAALATNYIFFGLERTSNECIDQMNGALLGPGFSEKEILSMCRKNRAQYNKYDDFNRLCNYISDQIANGRVVGWFQGRMEFGPRSLGNRSILGDPRNPFMQLKLNLKIKYRESFRPFAPSVLEEDLATYFNLNKISPYMLMVAPILQEWRYDLPINLHDLSLSEKQHLDKGILPAITHVDFSARIQTVHKETNPRFWKLIQTFKRKTGCGLIINTSFNVRGEPIVCTPYDAYKGFMNTEMDFLVINDFVFAKDEQPDYKNKKRWQPQFVID